MNHASAASAAPASAPPARKRRSRLPTTERLVLAGRKLFARRGYDGASVRAITQEARTNLGAVTYHFGSKHALYEQVLASVLQPLALRVSEAGRGEDSPLARLERVVRAIFDHLADHPDMPQLMVQEIAAGKRPPRGVADNLGTALRVLAGVIAEGQQRGEIRSGDPVLLAISVIAQPVHLTLIRPLAGPVAGLHLGNQAVRARVIEHAVDFVRAGLAAGPQDAGDEEGAS